jgi:predicted transcriptional regulator
LLIRYFALLISVFFKPIPSRNIHNREGDEVGIVTLKEIKEILGATIITDSVDLDLHILSACSADMMSAVLYYHTPNSLLITGLVQPQVIRTAEIAGIKSIVFVLDKKPDDNIIKLANQKKIHLLCTPFCMYTASGKLFQAGMPSCLGK